MSDRYCVINNELLPVEDAALGVADLSIQRAYGVFDFFRTVHGRPVFWEDHLDRLERSTAAMRLPLPFDRATLKAKLGELMARNDLADSGIRVTVTGGYSPDAYAIATPNVLITQQPMIVPANPAPLNLITHEHQRQLPHVKTIDYLMAIWLRERIEAARADDVLYHNGGILTECPRSNVFVVTADGALATPARNVLLGITRKHLLPLAAPHVETVERDITLDELADAREVFITGTSKKIAPVGRIDGRTVGNGELGETTRFLAGLMDECVAGEVG